MSPDVKGGHMRMKDETHTYEAGGLPVALTLPAGEHQEILDSDWIYITQTGGCEFMWCIDDEWPSAWGV